MAAAKGRKQVRLSYTLCAEPGDHRHRFGVNAVALNAANTSLFSAGRDAIIREWNLSNLESPPKVYEDHCDWVNDIILCEHDQLLASASSDCTVKLWSTTTPATRPATTLFKHEDYIKALAYAEDRKMLFSGGLDRMVVSWDLTRGAAAAVCAVDMKAEQSVYSLATNREGTLVLVGSPDGVVRLWDPRTAQRLTSFKGHGDTVRALAVKADGTRFLSASTDCSFKLWDIGHSRCIATYDIHTDSVWAMVPRAGFDAVYTASRNGQVFHTDLTKPVAGGEDTHSTLLFKSADPVLKVAVSATERDVWVATTSSTLHCWPIVLGEDGQSGRKVRRGEEDGEATFVSRASAPLRSIPGAPGIVVAQMLNDRVHVLTRDTEGTVEKWNIVTGRRVQSLGMVDFDEQLKHEFIRRAVMPWCTLDTRLGMLTVHLEEKEFVAAYLTLGDILPPSDLYNPGTKINLGAVVVQALLRQYQAALCLQEHTRRNPEDNRPAQAIVDEEFANLEAKNIAHCTFSLPEQTTVVISEKSSAAGIVIRFRPNECGRGAVHDQLCASCPSWINDILFKPLDKSLIPSIYFLFAADTTVEPARVLGSGAQTERLMGPPQLNGTVLLKYVADTILKGAGPPDIEILCNGEVLLPTHDLATIRQFIWRKSDDIKMLYRRKAPA